MNKERWAFHSSLKVYQTSRSTNKNSFLITPAHYPKKILHDFTLSSTAVVPHFVPSTFLHLQLVLNRWLDKRHMPVRQPTGQRKHLVSSSHSPFYSASHTQVSASTKLVEI